MIRVLHVMSRMAPSGTELQLVGMLRAARDASWTPTLCVLYPGFELTAAVRDEGIDVLEIGGGRRHADRFARLRRVARSGDFDVVHTSLWGAGAFGRAALLGPGRPAVVMSERRVEHFRGRGRRAVDRALARATDQWIGNSQDVVDFVVGAHAAPRERVHLCPNGIDTGIFHPGPDRGARSGPMRIGALGRLVHQKGFDVLLDCLAQVLAGRDVELVIVGEGELRADLERRAGGLPVRLPGALPGGPAVADFLRGLDLFVMPSRYEGLPNAVLEAQACGVPVVATDVPGMRQAVGPDTRLVPADDPAALAAAVLAELADGRGASATGGRVSATGPGASATGPGASATGGPSVRTFADVAADHRRVFDLAIEHNRRARAGRPG